MKVVIVGGGSAGWICAAFMDAYLNGVRGGPKSVDITVVESKAIGRIGVGEATVPTIRRTLAAIGVKERDFMRATNATFKQSIQFAGWRDGGDADVYLHPFSSHIAPSVGTNGLSWIKSDRSVSYASMVSLQAHATHLALSPKLQNFADFKGPMTYAYHLDAIRFADFLCALATKRGVTHVIDDVVDVETGGGDRIDAVVTKGGVRLEADLFVDCTGFARRLIGKALGAEFESFSDFLLCDRAVACPLPYELHRPERMEASTLSMARDSGWIWDVPLQNRRGSGYVYSSQFTSDEEAEADLIAYLGEAARDLPKNRIKFESGHLLTPWKGNCVAIGLAGGFLEPLESTGIWFIEKGVDLLCELFPRFGEQEHCRDLYNHNLRRRYRDTADFINLHYCLTQRTDTPFWREVQKPERISPTLRKQLQIWETKLPSPADIDHSRTLFGYQNFEFILFGMGWTPASSRDPEPGAKPPDVAVLRRQERQVEQTLSPHEEFLKRYLAPGAENDDGARRGAAMDPLTLVSHFADSD